MERRKKRGTNSIIDTIKKYTNPFVVYILVLVLLFLFNETRANIVFSKTYYYLGGIFFLLSFAAFVVSIFYYLYQKRDEIRKKYQDKRELLSESIVVVFSAFFLLYYLRDYVSGRFLNLWKMLGDVFIDDIAARSTQSVTSFVPFFYTFLSKMFGMTASPGLIVLVNLIAAFLVFYMIYLIALKVTNNRIVSILVLAVVSTSKIFRWNFASIEYTVFALLFVLLSIYFICRYFEENNVMIFIIALLSTAIASFVLFELSFVLVAPLLLYYVYFSKNKNKKRNVNTRILDYVTYLAVFLFSYSAAALVNYLVYDRSPFLQNNFSNITQFLSLFFVIGLFAALFFISRFIVDYKSRKYHLVNLLSLFTVFMVLFQTIFSIQKINVLWGSTFYYFAFLVILSFALVDGIVMKFCSKKNKNLMLYILIITMSILAVYISASLVVDSDYSKDLRYREYKLLSSRMDFDTNCYILKASVFQPNLDYYLGNQEKAIYLGLHEDFYRSLGEMNKSGKCFYYHHDLSFQGYEPQSNDPNFMSYVNDSRVTEIMSQECHPDVEFETETPITCDTNLKFMVIRYDC